MEQIRQLLSNFCIIRVFSDKKKLVIYYMINTRYKYDSQ